MTAYETKTTTGECTVAVNYNACNLTMSRRTPRIKNAAGEFRDLCIDRLNHRLRSFHKILTFAECNMMAFKPSSN